jgi:hypothetical protein
MLNSKTTADQVMLPFPREAPVDYLPLTDEPPFEAGKHLALESPRLVVGLTDLGYSDAAVEQCPSAFGYSEAFRILSEEGVAILRDICARIYLNRNESGGTGESRLGSFARGAGYRSRFIRDFCDSPELATHLSTIAGVQLGRHSVPAVACGINYAPEDISKAVDTWHVDSVSFDVVMMLSDPATIRGGEFQVFHGTKEEGQALLGIRGEEGSGVEIAADRVRTIPFPRAGFGFLQQGNMIFHRACRLEKQAERITMVPSFEVLPLTAHDATNSINMLDWGDPGIAAELSRRELWRASARLQGAIEKISLRDSPETLHKLIGDALKPLAVLHESLEDTKP